MSKIGDYYIKDDRPIGKGTFGTVYQAYKDKHPEKIYALKKIDMLSLNQTDQRHCEDEVRWMRDLQHPHIVQLHDSFRDQERYLIIVMEYCQGGSLKNYIQKSGPVPEEECLEIIRQICSALRYLHGQGKMHRDVKTDNIFLTDDKTAKLGDLGLLRLLESTSSLTRKCGSPLYRSPEIFAGENYNEKTDIWSFGCCIYEIATKRTPFHGWTEEELCTNVQREMVEEKSIPYSEGVRSLVLRMLQKDPAQRPTIDDVSNSLDSFLHKSSSPHIEAEDMGAQVF